MVFDQRGQTVSGNQVNASWRDLYGHIGESEWRPAAQWPEIRAERERLETEIARLRAELGTTRRFRLDPKPGEGRDPERIDGVLAKVRELWEKYPDWRLGQLIENAARSGSGGTLPTFYVEDDELMEGLDFYLTA